MICSDIVSAANASAFQMFEFLDNPDNKDYVKEAHASVKDMIDLIKRTDEVVQDSSRRATLQKLLATAERFDSTIDVISGSVSDAISQYYDRVQPLARQLMEDMNNMGHGLHRSGNLDGLIIVADAWDNLASARSSLGHFAESRDMTEAGKIQGYLTAMNEEVEKIAPFLVTREGQQLYDRLVKTKNDMATAVGNMEKFFAEANTHIASMLAEAKGLRDTITSLSADVDAAQNTLGPKILGENEAAQKYMLGISVGGVILGLVFASLIALGIIGVLNKLALFAGAISRGDFSQHLDISERGEIGTMSDAMREIPKVLSKVTTGANVNVISDIADEVRKLAEKTMTATQEVGSSISAIQNSARHNIDEVGSAVGNVTDATELANASGEALSEIVTLAAANSAVVASIATAAEEQSATSEELSRALEEISSVVGETTEGIIQSSAAVQDLSSMAQELRRVMENLK